LEFEETMFDIGWGELLIIGMVALIAIGPKELPGVLRALGQMMGKVRRMASDFQAQFQEAMREAEMADIKKELDAISDAAPKIDAPFDPASFADDLTQTAGSEPSDAADKLLDNAGAADNTSRPEQTGAAAETAGPASGEPQGAQAQAPDERAPATAASAAAGAADEPKTESLQGRPG
jgi:sec-independent protein translocase protein TatB